MYKKPSFLITGTIVMAAMITFYTVNVANAQSLNMTKNTAGQNMTKLMNMTAGGGANTT